MIYLSSDLHLEHDKDFIYKPRECESVDEMNRTIIYNFNKIVKPDDDLYLLGDSIMGKLEPAIDLFKQLNGKIHLIWGNHDTLRRQKAMSKCENVVEVLGYSNVLKFHKYHFYLSHYPAATANFDINEPLTKKVLCLSGHTHSKNLFEPFGSLNVSVDAHYCYPLSIETAIELFKNYHKFSGQN